MISDCGIFTDEYMIQEDIIRNNDLINEALAWADKYGKESFPRDEFKNYRRKLKRIAETLSENCSAAAYGESQVGKSYLMSSLLSTPNAPFMIRSGGKDYRFIDAINPSGGNNTKKESTGVVTRFTIRQGNAKMSEYVKITNLSVVDIILMLADSYYNDVKIDPDKVLMKDEINVRLNKISETWRKDSVRRQDIITEDDIKDICDYLAEIIGNPAANICKSNFCKIISSNISYIPADEWNNVFGLLWNNNEEINLLFNKLITEYGKIDYMTEVYVPFDAVLRSKGTILKIDWLDGIFGQADINPAEEQYTDIFDCDGNLVRQNFSKAYLSALTAELTFVLAPTIAEERPFLRKIDLLDFPGARSRRHYGEYDELKKVLPTILRRGKVAYLFNKYSRSLKISAVLFCHHNDQGTEATIGNSIDSWIRTNIGETQDKRAAMLSKTNGIAPLFFVCTKFNIDLERVKIDSAGSDLDSHWARFNTIIPEIIKPARWLDEWVTKGGIFPSPYFRNVYLLRDFYWSAKNGVFDGYEEGLSVEKGVHVFRDYPGYFDDLKRSFLRNPFVKKHFSDPEQAWNDVATVNNDGSKAIIRNLNSIAEVLDDARRDRYAHELADIRNDVASKLNVYYEPDDPEKNNERVKKIIGDIKIGTDFKFGSNPELFGRIIDNMMVSPADLRIIAYDIIIRHVEVPQSVSSIITIRASAGIDISDKREKNIRKLSETYNKDEQELKDFFSANGISLEDVLSDDNELLSTVPSVITKHILDFWNAHVNAQAKKLGETLPHADEITFMILNLFDKLGVRKAISDRIGHYYNVLDRTIVSNAIADYAALTLNNFVSTAGRGYMSDEDIRYVARKSAVCHLDIDLSLASSGSDVRRQPLIEVLTALDQSRTEINNPTIDLKTLQKLPFWSSYRRWQNYLAIGLLYTSEISNVDPVANKAIKNIIDQNEALYN